MTGTLWYSTDMRTSVQDRYFELAVREDAAIDALLSMDDAARRALGLNEVLQSSGAVDSDGNRVPRAAVKVLNQTDTVLEVRIDGYIWSGVLWDIQQQIRDFGKTPESLIVRIASGGGSAFAGYAIFNYLRTLKSEVTTVADGLAASAAALIFLAGNKRLVAPYMAQIMFHHALSFIDILVRGYKETLEKVDTEEPKRQILQILQNLDDDITDLMVAKTAMDAEKADAIMVEERFINRKEALELGIATGVDEDPGNEGDKDKEENSESSAGGLPAEKEADAAAAIPFDAAELADCIFGGDIQ